MYYLDRARVLDRMRQKGIRSIGALAQMLGLHRNTVQQYLSGKRVIAPALESLLTALDLDLADVVVRQSSISENPAAPIADFIDDLSGMFPHLTFILFGSRSRRTNRPYSDFDVGVYSRKGLSHSDFRKVFSAKCELEKVLPFFVDLVNLNAADPEFLDEIQKSWVFLNGKQKDWTELQTKVAA